MAGMDGQQIYDNFHSGQGPGTLTSSASNVQKLVETYNELGGKIKTMAGKLESSWTGNAAGAAQRGAGPLAVEFLSAAPHLDKAQDLMHQQGSSFDRSKNTVKPVPPAPSEPTGTSTYNPYAGGNVTNGPTSQQTSDYESGVAAHNAANQHNVDVMSSYEKDSSYNTTNMPQDYGTVAPDNSDVGLVSPQSSGGHHTTSPSTYSGGTGGSGGGSAYSGGAPTNSYGGYSGGTGAVAPGNHSSATPHAPGSDPSGNYQGPTGVGATPGVGGGGRTGSQSPDGTNTAGVGSANVPGGGLAGGSAGAPGAGGSTGSGAIDPMTGMPIAGAGGFGGAGADITRSGSGFGRTGSGGFGSGGFGSGAGGAGSARGSGNFGGSGGAGGARSGAGAPEGGARSGIGNAAAAEEAAMRRGMSGARGAGGMGGMPVGAGAKGDDDKEHQRPSYLVEPDPDDLFGGDLPPTAPPVIGE